MTSSSSTKRFSTSAAIATALLALTVGSTNALAQGQSQSEGVGQPGVITHPVNPREGFAPTAGSTGQLTPKIGYHGGPVLGTPNVYLIWYGNWNQSNGSDNAAGQQLVNDFLHGLNNSPYYKINGSYGTPTGSILAAGSTADAYSQGSNLSDAAVQAIVSRAISSSTLPLDTNGIYLVLTSSDVAESSGFCSKYCGWHTAGTISGTNIKYAFIGNANRCLSACAAQTISPNNNAGVDGMLSVIAHELEETNTDPNLNAWYNSRGYENGDMCAWTFGSHQTLLPSGAWFNMTLSTIAGGSNNYLIQRNLDVNSKCYVDYVSKTQ
jgi:hypothetical protein